MQRTMLYLSLAALCLAAPLAQAHGFYVNLSRYALAPGEGHGEVHSVRAYIGYGHYYPVDETLDRSELTRYELVHPGGKRTALDSTQDGYLVADARPEGSGAHAVLAEYKPHFFTIYEEDGETKYAMKPKTEVENVKITYHYDVFGKALLQVGPPEEGGHTQPLGERFEIVPLSNPFLLKPGESQLEVLVLRDGKPEPRATVQATHAGHSVSGEFLVKTRTDADGKASIPMTHAGPWLVHAHKQLDPPAELAGQADEMHYEAALTFSLE